MRSKYILDWFFATFKNRLKSIVPGASLTGVGPGPSQFDSRHRVTCFIYESIYVSFYGFAFSEESPPNRTIEQRKEAATLFDRLTMEIEIRWAQKRKQEKNASSNEENAEKKSSQSSELGFRQMNRDFSRSQYKRV